MWELAALVVAVGAAVVVAAGGGLVPDGLLSLLLDGPGPELEEAAPVAVAALELAGPAVEAPSVELAVTMPLVKAWLIEDIAELT